MTEAGWESEVIAALARLTEADVLGVEVLLLDELASWVLSDANPGSGYDEVSGGVVISGLFNAIANATEYQPERQPPPPDELALARRALVQGAHEYAAHERGIALLVTRLMPAAVAELNRNAGDVSQQIYWAYFYALFVLASGIAGEQIPAVARGVGLSFSGWSALMSDGFKLPGVSR